MKKIKTTNRAIDKKNSIDAVELALDQADYAAETNPKRMTHEEVFNGVREIINREK